MNANTDKIRVAIVGASGYTGAELVRLLSRHARVDIKVLTADRKAGQTLASVFPQLASLPLPDMIKLDAVNWDSVDVVFCCLPHATTQEVIKGLPSRLKIIDLSADFRLKDVDVYAEWYGGTHAAPELQKEAVYGLAEINRDAIKQARLVANPGCYPTSVQLPLVPLLEAGLVQDQDIIIDSKSGVSGAGRAPKEGTLFCEVTEGIHAYGVAKHRHAPEIEQGLSEAAGKDVIVNFTPHLMPMSRGILSSIYVKLADGKTADDVRDALVARYADEPFVLVLADGLSPATRHVRGSNFCQIGVFADRVPGRVIILSVIDNVVKGASGQAVQCMNLMCGFDETAGLEQLPLFP